MGFLREPTNSCHGKREDCELEIRSISGVELLVRELLAKKVTCMGKGTYLVGSHEQDYERKVTNL